MDHLEDFYIVLPSNSSMEYYPDNTTTCFTTHLSREIKLVGEWYVGLAEIHIPCTIQHIQKSEAYYNFNLGAEKKEDNLKNEVFYFPCGVYESVEELANSINNVLEVQHHQRLFPAEFQKGYYSLMRTCECKQPHYTVYNEKIRRIFGFEDYVHRQRGSFVTGASAAPDIGSRPACLARAIPDQMYVYTDICEPYAIGDTQAALLRIVGFDNVKYKFGASVVKQFAPIHYIPLLHHNFQSIVIDIRDERGQRIPFAYGTLTVVLHCKKKRF